MKMSEPFNELKQVEMSVKAAQNIVGKATMHMDQNLLDAATEAVNNAHAQIDAATTNGPGTDESFIQNAKQVLATCEEQLTEAKQ
jgi:hypothetical protein